MREEGRDDMEDGYCHPRNSSRSPPRGGRAKAWREVGHGGLLAAQVPSVGEEVKATSLGP
jgi:hypothetical protein